MDIPCSLLGSQFCKLNCNFNIWYYQSPNSMLEKLTNWRNAKDQEDKLEQQNWKMFTNRHKTCDYKSIVVINTDVGWYKDRQIDQSKTR